MNKLRARITNVGTRDLACKVDAHELTEQEYTANVKGGESTFPEWLQNPMKASIRIEDPKLFEAARAAADKNAVLSVDNGKVVEIEVVHDGEVCHFCGNRRFAGEFVHEALCNRVACRKLIKDLTVVTRPREKDEMWGGDAAVQSRYVYQGDDGKKEYFQWEVPGKRRFLGREFFHVYRAHKARICSVCAGNQEVWKLADFQKWLQSEFSQNKKTFNVTGAVIAD